MNNEIITTLKILGLDQITTAFNAMAAAGSRALESLATAGARVAPALTGIAAAVERVRNQVNGLRTVVQQVAARVQSDIGRMLTSFRSLGGVISTVSGHLGRFLAAFGLLGGLFSGGLIFGLTRFVDTTNLAVEGLGDLAEQLGETLADTSTLASAFAEAGVGTEGLENTFRRLARTVAQTWDEVVKSTREGANAAAQAILSVQSAAFSAAQAQQNLRNINRDLAFEERANALSVISARLAVNEAYTNYRAAVIGANDAVVEAERANLGANRAALGILQSRLQLQQALAKQADDQASREDRRRQAAQQAELAELNLLEARRKAAEQQANDISRIADFVQKLITGVDTSGIKINDTVENIVKGIVTVAGVGAAGLEQLRDSFGSTADTAPRLIPVLEVLADVLKNTESQTRRMAIALQFFGRSVSQDTVNFLAQGSAAIRKHREELKALGITYREESGGIADAFKRARASLVDTLEIFRNRLGLTFGPAATKLLQEFRTFLIQNFDAIEARFLKIGQAALAMATALGNLFRGVSTADLVEQELEKIQDSGKELDPFTQQVLLWQRQFELMLESVKQFWTEVKALFSGDSTAIRRIVDQVFDAIVASILARISQLAAEGEKAMAQLPRTLALAVFNALADAGEQLVEFAAQLPTRIFNVFANIGEIIVTLVNGAIAQVNILINSVVTGFVNIFTSISDAIRGAFDVAINFVREKFNELVNFMRTAVTTIIGVVGTIADALVAPFRAAGQAIISIWTAVIEFIKKSVGALGNLLPGSGTAAGGGAKVAPPLEFAGGGQVRGPGTASSDSILAWLSDGEWVIPAKAVMQLVRRFGSGVMDMINQGILPIPKFSSGGLVRLVRTPSFAMGGRVGASKAAAQSNLMSGRDLGTLTLVSDRGQKLGTVFATEDVVRGLHRYSVLNTLSSGGRKPSSYRG